MLPEHFSRREFPTSLSVATRWRHGLRRWIKKPCGTPRTWICWYARQDFQRIIAELQAVGFIHQNVAGVDLFLDGPQGSVRSAIHILFAGEKVRPDYLLPAPEVGESEAGPDFAVPTLEALVRMKLTSFRLKDQVHLLDLLEVGLIDASWSDRLPVPLAARLKQLIETRDRET